jgi:hypothetical protein
MHAFDSGDDNQQFQRNRFGAMTHDLRHLT